MLYAALTFWLLVIVLLAWGVHELWSSMVKPKVLNTLLLPGTLVAQAGHVLGLLVTGATITNTTLYKDDESGAPETTPDPRPRIPVVGPIVIAMLPIVACATAIFVVARAFGGPFLSRIDTSIVRPVLPTTIDGMWQLLRDQITLAESFGSAVAGGEYSGWRSWLFLYLLMCLTVRIAPFPGTLRGCLGAIVILGVAAAIVTSLFAVADPRVQTTWAVLGLTVGTLTLLLLVSLVVRGSIGLIRLLRSES